VAIGIVGLLVNGVGLGFVAIQVGLARRQARQARQAQTAQERDFMLRRKESTMATPRTILDTRPRPYSL
jgi:hypothetical protein